MIASASPKASAVQGASAEVVSWSSDHPVPVDLLNKHQAPA
jgi:hypothetical protein